MKKEFSFYILMNFCQFASVIWTVPFSVLLSSSWSKTNFSSSDWSKRPFAKSCCTWAGWKLCGAHK